MAALQGKVAVITGGSGIGLAAAKRFVAEGAFVFITGRQQAELDKAVKEIGRNVVAVKSDVSNLGDLAKLSEATMSGQQQFDLLIIGSGEAGKNLAWTMGKTGRRTAVVERKLIGGSCPNIACLPSKNIIHSAKVAELARCDAEFGPIAGVRYAFSSMRTGERLWAES